MFKWDVGPQPSYEIALLMQEIRPALPWIGVTRLYFRHTYLRVTVALAGAVHEIYLDGVPSGGFLTIRLGDTPYYDFGGERLLWTSGLSEKHAFAARALLKNATEFPARRYFYLLAFSNSNSATRSLLRRCGISLPRRQRIKLAWDPRYAGWALGVPA